MKETTTGTCTKATETPQTPIVVTETSKNHPMLLMEKARATASFDSRQLTYFLWGGKDATERREAAFTRVENALGLSDTTKLPKAYANQSREGQYLEGLDFGKVLMEDELKHRHGVFDSHTHKYDMIISSPFGHNPMMFSPTLRLQTTPEQRAYWMPLVESGKIIGTYAQTEIGHGTFLRGLETTATFDPQTDEFVIHSPTLTSAKYWPSALGFSASHGIVMANLILSGKNYGVHPFMVQLRSLDDGKNLLGIETGDGFSVLSGFPAIVGSLAAMPTLEGENYVMYQQTARYLMKAAIAINAGRDYLIDGGVAYLASAFQAPCSFHDQEFLDPEKQLEMFRHRASRLVFYALSQLEHAQKEEKLPYAQAWNKHMLPLVHAARAHVELFVLEGFIAQVQLCPDAASTLVLNDLRSLFALTAIENPASPGALGFFEDGYISFAQLEGVRVLVDGLLEKLVPEIIGLGDAWGFSDACLGSALGMRDGNVYERLMGWTRQLPLNVQAREDGGVQRSGFEGVIGPMLRSRL